MEVRFSCSCTMETWPGSLTPKNITRMCGEHAIAMNSAVGNTTWTPATERDQHREQDCKDWFRDNVVKTKQERMVTELTR